MEKIHSQSIECAIPEFVNMLKLHSRSLSGHECLLRVAAYFTEGEALAFSVALPQEAMKLLLDHRMDLEVTRYPCMDDLKLIVSYGDILVPKKEGREIRDTHKMVFR